MWAAAVCGLEASGRDFVEVLAYGMPSTGRLGVCVDCILMVLTYPSHDLALDEPAQD